MLEEKEQELLAAFSRRLWEPLQLHLLEPLAPAFQLQGKQLAVGTAGVLLGGHPISLASFDFLGCLPCPGEGMGAVPSFLEVSSPRDPTGVQLPRLRGAPTPGLLG